MSSIQDGVTYHLKNENTHDSCMELDADKREVGASPRNEWPNQKWIFHKIAGGNRFYIQSVKNQEYLVPPEWPLRNGLQLIVKDKYEWLVEAEPHPDFTVRIHPAEDTSFCVDLKDGSPGPGAVVQLWKSTPGDKNQIWKVTQD